MKKFSEEFWHMCFIWLWVAILLVVGFQLQGCAVPEKHKPELYAGFPSEQAVVRRIPSRNINEGISCKDKEFKKMVCMTYEDYLISRREPNCGPDLSVVTDLLNLSRDP